MTLNVTSKQLRMLLHALGICPNVDVNGTFRNRYVITPDSDALPDCEALVSAGYFERYSDRHGLICYRVTKETKKFILGTAF